MTALRTVAQQALEAMRFALHVGFDESSESQIKKADKASRQHWSAIRAIEAALAQQAEPVEPAAMYETDVQLVARLPEFDLLYVQDSQGTRFAVDQDTELQTELLPSVTFRAQVNAEGYAREISRSCPIAGDSVYTAPPQRKPLTSDKDRPDQGATYVEGYGYVDTRAVRAIERALEEKNGR